ncbi:MAG: hypothetical protein M3R61_12385 [Chloroflexota bacterium]|nr:hypothetical protein [Chloroflexota bacterium]
MIARDVCDDEHCDTMLRSGFTVITEGDHKGSPLHFGVIIAVVFALSPTASDWRLQQTRGIMLAAMSYPLPFRLSDV